MDGEEALTGVLAGVEALTLTGALLGDAALTGALLGDKVVAGAGADLATATGAFLCFGSGAGLDWTGAGTGRLEVVGRLGLIGAKGAAFSTTLTSSCWMTGGASISTSSSTSSGLGGGGGATASSLTGLGGGAEEN